MTVAIKENFESIGLSKLDSKNRVTISAVIAKLQSLMGSLPISEVEMLIGEQGDILLRPRSSIPTHELWLHQNPKALAELKSGIKDVSQGKVKKVKNLDKFLQDL